MLKKIISITLAVVLLACAFVGCSSKKVESNSDWEYIEGKGKLIIGVTEYEPMNYMENGEWTGFDTEYAQAVCEILGVEAEFIIIDWDTKAAELDSKAIDCVWNGMTINDNVLKSMDCTNPYVINAQVVVMKSSEIANYSDAESLKDLSFAVESGSAGQEMAIENGYEYVAVTAQSDALMEVASGSADACIIDITMANAMTGEGTSYADLGACLNLSEEEYGIGCRQGSDLVQKINDATDELIADGTLQAIADKYGVALVD